MQGFLSDLLKKANRPHDEPKLQEYTQTIVSPQRPLGALGWPNLELGTCPRRHLSLSRTSS